MEQQSDVVLILAAVLSVIPLGAAATVALSIEHWASRRWGPHPDRLWWLGLGVMALGVAAWYAWVRFR